MEAGDNSGIRPRIHRLSMVPGSDAAGVYWVSRLKDNADYQRVEQRPVPAGGKVLADEVISSYRLLGAGASTSSAAHKQCLSYHALPMLRLPRADVRDAVRRAMSPPKTSYIT